MRPATLETRRTFLCPTLTAPSEQRDGMLMRVPLVGGEVTVEQAMVVADVASELGSGVIELTNRANLQVRGIATANVAKAADRLLAVGFGDAVDRIVTVDAFAGTEAIRLRGVIADGVRADEIDGLSAKFVVHVVDSETIRGVNPRSSADIVVRAGEHSDQFVLAKVAATIAACRAVGPTTRVKDLPARESKAQLDSPESNGRHSGGPTLPAIGVVCRGDGRVLAVGAARLGRIHGSDLQSIARVAQIHGRSMVTVSSERTIAVDCSDANDAQRVLAELSAIGLLIDPSDSAFGVVACIGAVGCWQTDLDTLRFAHELIRKRPTGDVIHVSGCEKSCAWAGSAAVTFVGRNDSSGFDRYPEC